ncbi:hypothetical protein Gbem_1830 [Citrifermentans bemidjiense Bem]|uniref:Uncharacterized protein n=1 Tax=Citrifermentans bemidjiense (strain ATCC BAA-1014 / DSM 16622 / JCM 12645 / Bem) TaxID=404380 RepID=B5EAY4_CITBB|nr:hypothetical protein [Citrifermentans bemidjiense]ACH38845.1 hypothetical protein Gbem_1830 [Citrifermentans bemidjiense Bem]
MKIGLGKTERICPTRAAGKDGRRASALNGRHSTRQIFGPLAFSVCLHLMIIAAVAAEWQARTEVVWVCTLFAPEPAPVDPAPPEPADLKGSTNSGNGEVTKKVAPKKDQPDQLEQPEPMPMEPAATQLVQLGAAKPANISSSPVILQEPAAISGAVLALPMMQFSSARVPEQSRLPRRVAEAPVPPGSTPVLPLQQFRRDGEPSSMRGDRPHLSSVQTVAKSLETEAVVPSQGAARDFDDAGYPHPEPFLPMPSGAATSGASVIKGDSNRPPGNLQSSSAGLLSTVSPDGQKRRQVTAAAVTQPLTARQTVAGPPSTASEPIKPEIEKTENPTAEMLRQAPPIFEARLKGDLELYVTGSDVAANRTKVMVHFRPYPKRRHHIPISMRESRKIKSIIPKISFTGKDTIQAVIEVASDGIYEFRGSEDTGPQEARCTLTIHGTSSRPIIKEVGTRKVGKDSYILKVMMPEGVLWDDDTSFSGTIKDSDGITKFNSETGLVWKEY